MITADFGLHNVVWHDRRPSFVDFNDLGLGLPAYDLAIATSSVSGRDPDLATSLLDGYGDPPEGWGDEVCDAAAIRMMRWRAHRPGGKEGARVVRELFAALSRRDR